MSETTTILVIQGVGLPPYATRGATQTLAPVREASYQRRTVNGTLVDLSASELRKYRSTIACRDMDAPALDGIWPGTIVTVDCIAELTYPDTTDGAPARDVVEGSERTEDGFVHYRPRLTMMVVDYDIDTDEYGAAVGWRLDLEEV